jgi:hypothetical protein
LLTDEAVKIQREHHLTEQRMFEDAQGDKDLVWTKASQAVVAIRSTMSFICLIGFGTYSLAAAAMLVAVYINAAATPPKDESPSHKAVQLSFKKPAV